MQDSPCFSFSYLPSPCQSRNPQEKWGGGWEVNHSFFKLTGPQIWSSATPAFTVEETDLSGGGEDASETNKGLRGGLREGKASARPQRKSKFQGLKQKFQSHQGTWDCLPQLLSLSKPRAPFQKQPSTGQMEVQNQKQQAPAWGQECRSLAAHASASSGHRWPQYQRGCFMMTNAISHIYMTNLSLIL